LIRHGDAVYAEFVVESWDFPVVAPTVSDAEK
jgi:hypothetical protein